jgi:N-acetylmuramoyl-L-alanine amidase
MRYLILSLALIPSALCVAEREVTHHKNTDPVTGAGYGRGLVNPPTFEESKQIKCLAVTIFGEARGEPEQGMLAVGYTAANRAVNKTVCGVVLAPMQYSVFNENPELRAAAMSLKIIPKHDNIIDAKAWKQSLRVAQVVIQKEVPDPTNGATHYLSPDLMKELGYQYPLWSKQFKLVAIINNHRFYKQPEKKIVIAAN